MCSHLNNTAVIENPDRYWLSSGKYIFNLKYKHLIFYQWVGQNRDIAYNTNTSKENFTQIWFNELLKKTCNLF